MVILFSNRHIPSQKQTSMWSINQAWICQSQKGTESAIRLGLYLLIAPQ